MCDCVVCITGILLVNDMKALRSIIGNRFGLQNVNDINNQQEISSLNKNEVNLKQPILKSREMEENDSKQRVIKYKFSYKRKRNVKTKQQFPLKPIRLGLMLRPDLLNPKLES